MADEEKKGPGAKPVHHETLKNLKLVVMMFMTAAVVPEMPKSKTVKVEGSEDGVDSMDLMERALKAHPILAAAVLAKAIEFVSEVSSGGNGLFTNSYSQSEVDKINRAKRPGSN